MWEKISRPTDKLTSAPSVRFVLADGSEHKALGRVPLRYSVLATTWDMDTYVLEDQHLSVPLLLGLDSLTTMRMTIHLSPRGYTVPGEGICEFIYKSKEDLGSEFIGFYAAERSGASTSAAAPVEGQPEEVRPVLKKWAEISAEREVAENEKRFTELISCIKVAQENLIARIREQEKKEKEKVEKVMEQLKKESEVLKKKGDELKELSEMKDHVQFLQRWSCYYNALPTEGDLINFKATYEFSSEDLKKELSRLRKSLEKISQWDIKTLSPADFCPLTLDIITAHRTLFVSDGNKKVTRKRKKFDYPDHPDRFDRCAQVLCREPLTGTYCYWEVECTGDNMDIGVACKGLDRKGWGWECRLGNNDKSWSLRCSHSQYTVYHKNIKTDISLPYSPRIAVFLDRSAGSLSFYSISPTMTLLHTFSTISTEPLYAAFALESLFCSNASITICDLMP
ncbi:TRI16 protein, partial [Polypterus senegalus]